MDCFRKIFSANNLNVFGMVHIQALPGTPRNKLSVPEILDKALTEVKIYKDNHVDGLIIENMHDIPYVHTDKVGPEITASMAVICHQIKKIFTSGPVGVQILAGANKQALSVAKAAGLDFIRAEGFVFSHVADEGIMNACAGDLLRYRKQIGAEDILVFTDIKKKHSAHAITSDVDIADTAKAAEFFLSDGVIVTGIQTGQAADVSELIDVQKAVDIPVLIGSGVTNDNVEQYKSAHGLIVGSYFKKDGHWNNELDTDRLKSFMESVKSLRTVN
ncbi:uncharacterized protein F13E9.13, mitochondrial-like [Mytilus californianus]|uniref:uncharacterized protein F13E9.13, mitochondrial-like n=1 Tax=Mytilus californianus TaxID=6549 RepID=UPI00224620AA|nr:uncharacterized protein F13E9.13, mitochondrial-like [Mytilus californianus]